MAKMRPHADTGSGGRPGDATARHVTGQRDVSEILTAFERHEVAFVVVGGSASPAPGEQPPVSDLECVVDHDRTNLSRIARALVDIGARLRVAGLDDAKARTLDLPLDAESLGRLDHSTWRTDTATFDLLAFVRDREGHRLSYRTLAERARTATIADTAVAVAAVEALRTGIDPD